MTANFDVSRAAALAVTVLDRLEYGKAYADAMIALSQALASELAGAGTPVFAVGRGHTGSHQFAVLAAPFGGGHAASRKLRRAGFLASGIGLPVAPVDGDLNSLRIGTPELVRRGVDVSHAPRLAGLMARALTTNDPDSLADEVQAFRKQFGRLHFIGS